MHNELKCIKLTIMKVRVSSSSLGIYAGVHSENERENLKIQIYTCWEIKKRNMC